MTINLLRLYIRQFMMNGRGNKDTEKTNVNDMECDKTTKRREVKLYARRKL